ncbi:HIRAN domain-containing protein [Garciella nitratireducens]|uniref:HIRAN domain-containing protein n=1 Tax=Garciella nitratireducens DSM 15102 TaxID=1121911 RepID=A0A1T4L039_9FIRM|nr:HIRAN domain-containing protein [Garciella nitratireducens]SJZ48059.1 HIRAN domain-containing protein [Garciella nitratireducens DSM 15102]
MGTIHKNYFLTITGLNHYYGMKPIEIGKILTLVKDKNNKYDEEAIAVLLPYIGTIGYVANSPNTVVKGTSSAGRIYDIFEEEAYAQVLFATKESAICVLILKEDLLNLMEDFLKEDLTNRKLN